jgi:hypothetical protein
VFSEANVGSYAATDLPDQAGLGVHMTTGRLAISAALVLWTASAQGASPDGGRPRAIDLDLHAPPQGTTPQQPPAGSLLRPPRGSEPARYQLRPLSDGGYAYQGPTFGARIAADGTVTFSTRRLSIARDSDSGARVLDRNRLDRSGPVVGGGPNLRFDATDEYLRLLGKDPSRDAKAAFMAETLELRMKMALAARRELREAALADLPRRLDALWADPRLTRSERRQLLREIRAQSGDGPKGDAARAIVSDFERRHLSRKEIEALH